MSGEWAAGKWHERVPRDPLENLHWRLYALERGRESRSFRRALDRMCREDFLFWVNTFAWQFNPKAFGTWTKDGPFVTAPFQDKLAGQILAALRARDDLMIEKSRDMGASWLEMLFVGWGMLYRPLTKYLCVSRNEKAVDAPDDPDCLFWKLDYVLGRLPEWSRPPVDRRTLAFVNRRDSAVVTGQASTGKAGVGGRASLMVIDEFSQIREAREILDRTSDTAATRVISGTHKGVGTAFHDLCVRAANGQPKLRHAVLHWSAHPDKRAGLYRWDAREQRVVWLDPGFVPPPGFVPVCDGTPTGGPHPGLRSPWYDAECLRKGSARAVAADLDINPTGTAEQGFDPLMIGALIAQYAKPGVRCDLDYDRTEAKPRQFRPAAGGNWELWCRLDGGLPPPGEYAVGCDVAQGTGSTPSCASVADVRTGEKVAAFVCSTIEPREFAYEIVAACRLFRSANGEPAQLAWERPGPAGAVMGKHVLALRHPNLFYRRTESPLKVEVATEPGWVNTGDALQSLLLNYRDALRSRQFLNRSREALRECLSFVYCGDGMLRHSASIDPDSPSGARVNHGDRVVADGIVWKMVEQAGKLTGPAVSGATAAASAGGPGTLAGRRALARELELRDRTRLRAY